MSVAAGFAVRAAMPDAIAVLVAGVEAHGYAVVRNLLPAAVIAGLRRRVLSLDNAGALTQAGIGRGNARRERAEIRGDRIHWLDDSPQGRAETAAFVLLRDLRSECNRALLLGLFEFEGHYALYPAGASYGRHRDRFADDDARVLSCVLYLNDGWRADEGGALRLYVGGAAALDVVPAGGTLVVFLADAFDHEVLPATRPRLALTGWFRRRPC